MRSSPGIRSLAAIVWLPWVVACGENGTAGAGTPAARPLATAPASSWFVDVTREVGLSFAHETGATGELRMPEILGAGAALLDHDGDGDLDVYLTNGNREAMGAAPGEPTPNRLFRQEPGGRFVDATDESGLGDTGYGMGVAVGDVDNDGDADVYVANFGPDRLYRNRGDGTFEDATENAGIDVDGWSTSATFCDYDVDGFLDLYVVRYVRYDPRRRCADPAGRREYCTPDAFADAPDVLLRNRGDGTFADVTDEAGLPSASGAGLGVVCADLDDDGLPDFYVANDLDANQLWVNRGDGTFRDTALVRGAAYNLEGRAESGMGVVAADLDGDLDLDLFVTHLTTQTNTLYRNLGGARGFEDATAVSGLATSSLPFTGFGTAAVDIELDGDLDLIVVNGAVLRGPRPHAGVRLGAPWDLYAEPNLLYRNDGTGRFELADVAPELTTTPEIARGLAVGDVDADGAPDLLVSHVLTGPRLYVNRAPRRGGWLTVRAHDPRYRRAAIGAELILVEEDRRQLRTLTRGYGYLSSSDAAAYFALREGGAGARLRVRWPDGLEESFDVPGGNRSLTVVRGQGSAG